jgi:hypothetical protein
MIMIGCDLEMEMAEIGTAVTANWSAYCKNDLMLCVQKQC